MRNVTASKYNARSTALLLTPTAAANPWLISASRVNNAEAIAAEPYVVMRLSWLADSSCSAGTSSGTLASLHGIQNSESDSMRNDAISSQLSECISGIDA